MTTDTAAVSYRSVLAHREFRAVLLSQGLSVLGDQQAVQTNALRNLNAQEQATSGVDVNEELLHLLDYQRMVEGASKYLSVVNTAYDAILSIIR